MNQSISRGDIFYVRKSESNPSVGNEQQPGRPAIIVSNDRCNASSKVVEVVYLTLKQKKPLPTHVFVDTVGGISTALCEAIYSVDVSRLGAFMCSVTEEQMSQIDDALRISLALDAPPVNRCGCDCEHDAGFICDCGEAEDEPDPTEVFLETVRLRGQLELLQNLYFELLQTVSKIA